MPDITSVLMGRIEHNVPLKQFTTFFLGGPAGSFLEVYSEEELVEAARMTTRDKIPAFILGGGSNLVISDSGFNGMVIRNLSADEDRVDISNSTVTISSGRTLAHLVGIAWEHSLSGAETFTGIPGSVGGAICGNAGAYGKSISDVLESAEILFPDGQKKIVQKDFFQFGYRDSLLKREKYLIVNATFRFQNGDKTSIQNKIKDIAAQRHSKHPPREVGSAGSFFKNLDPLPGDTRRRPAGEFLEKAGAKGLSVGGASVYEKHANFIVNYGKACSSEVKELACTLKNRVFDLFGITLHEEVLYIG
ncbi:MAG: UDP-N-acetylmuramate dehydrogenase [Candidatus Riflebacteria bacterium]|nr:UDP-N-acetylmuramate dehydrogenase [Candidatus Riflebacteria bacterium]